jgi:hypothetical protein
MPVTGEDAVRDRPAVKREAHVRAAVVHGVDLVADSEQAHGVPGRLDDEAPRRPNLGEGRGSDD